MKCEGISQIILFKILFTITLTIAEDKTLADSNGYVVYCPCMGRKLKKIVAGKN